MQFKETFENTQWWEAKQMQQVRLCLLWLKFFKEKKSQKNHFRLSFTRLKIVEKLVEKNYEKKSVKKIYEKNLWKNWWKKSVKNW